MPEQPQLSWAERIAESKKNTFKPLDKETRYNFEIEKTEVKETRDGEPFIKISAKVLDGDRKNFKVNFNTFPEGSNPWGFLQLFEACGFGLQWLESANPSTHEIASNLVGRQFSSEVIDGKSKRDDGTFWPEYVRFNTIVANVPSSAQTSAPSQASSNFGSAPQQSQPQAPTQTPTSDPWNTNAPQGQNGNNGGMDNPFKNF